MKFAQNVLDLIGNTPLVRLRNVTAGLAPTVLAKIEYFNPGGSVKDCIAIRMVNAAERSGELQPGGTIVEPTSGNTGIGLALVAQQRGYHCIFVCPDKVSADKINTLRAYGLLDALFAGTASLADMIERHMSPPLPIIGSGEPVSLAVAALGTADALLVHVEGKPTGVITRQDLLGHLSRA